MIFEYNREKNSFINVLNGKCEKQAFKVTVEKEKLIIETDVNEKGETVDLIPVTFKGKLIEDNNKTILTGGFSNGFYLTGLCAFAALLIIARLTWSIYKMQIANIVLCIMAAVLLITVVTVVKIKGKKGKARIEELLRNLEK